MTPCIEGPTKPIAGADHKRPVTHWKLAPGRAWMLTPEGWEAVEVSAKEAKGSEYTFNLVWIRGATAAVFKLGNREYAQPTHAITPPRGARKKPPVPTAHRGSPTSPDRDKPEQVRQVASPVRKRKPIALRPL